MDLRKDEFDLKNKTKKINLPKELILNTRLTSITCITSNTF